MRRGMGWRCNAGPGRPRACGDEGTVSEMVRCARTASAIRTPMAMAKTRRAAKAAPPMTMTTLTLAIKNVLQHLMAGRMLPESARRLSIRDVKRNKGRARTSPVVVDSASQPVATRCERSMNWFRCPLETSGSDQSAARFRVDRERTVHPGLRDHTRTTRQDQSPAACASRCNWSSSKPGWSAAP
jgi:hypothetical protein